MAQEQLHVTQWCGEEGISCRINQEDKKNSERTNWRDTKQSGEKKNIKNVHNLPQGMLENWGLVRPKKGIAYRPDNTIPLWSMVKAALPWRFY